MVWAKKGRGELRVERGGEGKRCFAYSERSAVRYADGQIGKDG